VLARSVTLNVVGQAGLLLVGFASSLLLARLLGPSDRGLLALISAISSFCVVLFGIGIPFAVAYFGSLPERPSGAILGNTLVHAAVLALVLVPAFWALQGPLADTFGKGHGGRAWVLAALLVPITFLDYTTQNQVLGQHRFARYNLILVLGKVASVVVVVVLVGVLGLGVTGGVIALAASSAVVIALSLPRILVEGRPRFDRALMRRMLGYGSRVQIGMIFQLLNYRLDVIVLQFFVPLAAVGYYVVAQIIAELVTMLSSAFATTVLPLVAREEGRLTQTTVDSLRHHGILTIVAILGNVVFGPLVILYAFGHKFEPAIVPMLIILPGMWFLGTNAVVAGDLRGRGRPGTVSVLAGAAAALTLVLDLVLIPPFGVKGAAVASLCAYTALGVGSLGTLARITGLPVRALLPGVDDLRLYGRLLRTLATERRFAPARSEP
jgi:O-antigen/teichoic acid export membrane protein